MLQFNNNHIFTGYLKQFLSSFNLPACRVYTPEFEKFYEEHGYEHPKVIESSLPIVLSAGVNQVRPAVGITYLRYGTMQQYFWDTSNWRTDLDIDKNKTVKYWKNNETLHYNGNKILGLTTTLKNPTAQYNYQTHEYLGDYLRFLRDFEGINLMSMYNCFSNRLCNNIKFSYEWEIDSSKTTKQVGEPSTKGKTVSINFNAYDTNYKIYMLPVKLFENYTIAIDCYQGVEMFCGFYNEKLDTSNKAKNLMEKTYVKIPKTLFNNPFIYDKLDVNYWSWVNENIDGTINDMDKFVRAEIAAREKELKLFIKVPATNTSSIVVLEGDYRNFNDVLYTVDTKNGWQYRQNSTVANFETQKTYKASTLPDINSREFRPISKLQLLALNTGISYPFADRLIEYLVANVIVPNDATPDNIKRLQRVMEDCGYSFKIDGIWEPKMQMILYDYLMNSGKFTVEESFDNWGRPQYKVKDERLKRSDSTGNLQQREQQKARQNLAGNLRQRGQKARSECYDILGYGDKDAEKLYASWTVEAIKKNGIEKQQVTAKNTLENVDIYNNLYPN